MAPLQRLGTGRDPGIAPSAEGGELVLQKVRRLTSMAQFQCPGVQVQ